MNKSESCISICIGCGCDDNHACIGGNRIPCSWLRLDRNTGVGVCSECEDIVLNWDKGDRLQRTTNFRYCTLTGVDGYTSLEELSILSSEFPFVEFGFLYSPSRQGMPGRYPSLVTLQQMLEKLPDHIHVALHACGQGVSDLLVGESVARELGEMVKLRSGRVQLNFNYSRGQINIGELNAFIERFEAPVIIQHNHNNAECVTALTAANRSVLFDGSGGRGKSPDRWPRPLSGAYCGYAGGLGPDNLRQQIPKIQDVAGGLPYWIDMESSLRNEKDWFDAAKARQCLEIVRDFLTLRARESEAMARSPW